MNNDVILPPPIDGIPDTINTFVNNIFSQPNTTNEDICNVSQQLVQQVHDDTDKQKKPKSWWQSVKSAFNRGKTEGNGGIKGFFKGCWEATKTGWRNTNKYAKVAIGAGCLLAGPLLMPLFSGANAGSSATSATLQSASKISSWSYNLSYIGYALTHPTGALLSQLVVPVLQLATGVGSLISGGWEIVRDIAGSVLPQGKCFNVSQSKWNDIIEYAKYEHKQKCQLQQENDINSKNFIMSELRAVLSAIKTEYKYFYNSNYPTGQDKDLQVVLNEYLRSLRERCCNAQGNVKLKRKDVYPELSQAKQMQFLINKPKNNHNDRDEINNNSVNNEISTQNESLEDRNEGHQECVYEEMQNMKNKYDSYKNNNSNNKKTNSNNLEHLSDSKKSYLKNKLSFLLTIIFFVYA